MSSPKINNIVLAGCIICYSTVFFADVEKSVMSVKGMCVVSMK